MLALRAKKVYILPQPGDTDLFYRQVIFLAAIIPNVQASRANPAGSFFLPPRVSQMMIQTLFN
jgi:hypothetical protein